MRLVAFIPNNDVFKAWYERRDLANFIAIGCCHNHGPAASMGQHMSVAFECIARIERHANDTRDGATEKKILSLDRIIFEHTDSVTRL